MDTHVNAQIGQNIKRLRKKANISREKLAEITGISSDHLANVENGYTGISIDKIVKVINALNTSADEMFSGLLEHSYEPVKADCYAQMEQLSLEDFNNIEALLSVMKEIKQQTKHRK